MLGDANMALSSPGAGNGLSLQTHRSLQPPLQFRETGQNGNATSTSGDHPPHEGDPASYPRFWLAAQIGAQQETSPTLNGKPVRQDCFGET